MIYEDKIDWADRDKGSDLVSYSGGPFKDAVLGFNILVEEELEDIIERHVRDRKKVPWLPFAQRVRLVRALIGETPDDGIWKVVKALNDLRNRFAHSGSRTAEGIAEIEQITINILNHVKELRPDVLLSATSNQLDIITLAILTVRRFFREVNEALTKA